eukprot:CFRG3959T1
MATRSLETLHTAIASRIRKRGHVGGRVPQSGTVSPSVGSYVKGSHAIPLLSCTIGQKLRDTAHAHPNQLALVCAEEGTRITYKQLHELSDELAVGLYKLGIGKGDCVGVWLPNCSEYVLLQYATAKIGAILVTMNPAYRRHEAVHAINLVKCKALVITPRVSSTNYVDLVKDMGLGICDHDVDDSLTLSTLPSLKYVINISDKKYDGMVRLKDICNTGAVLEGDMSLHPNDTINIQFTSGTTGSPKAAALSHNNILNNGLFIANRLQYTSKDKICVPVPLYHCFGLVIGNLAALTKACTIVYPARTFDAETTLRAVESEKCTSLYGVPTHFITQLGHKNFDKYKLTSLRTGVMAGSTCPEGVMHNVIQKMNMKDITICYGMTETSPVSFQSSVTDPFTKRVTSVGTIHPHLEAKVVREDESLADINEIGELWVRGYAVFKGYYNGKPEDNPVTHDGWMKTGDLGTIDQNGFCAIVGRKKDIIIRGGENILPREIEEVIFKLKIVKQVSVVGVRSKKYGEEVCAVVSLHDGNESVVRSEIHKQVQDTVRRKLSHYKVPSSVVIMPMEDIPTTVTGKVMKHQLSEKVEKLYS